MNYLQNTSDIRKKVVLIISTLAILVVSGLLVSDFLVDDAYISFQYSRNLSDHGTLYFNIGESGPIGFTNPAYVFTMAIVRFLTFKWITFEIISRAISLITFGWFAFLMFANTLSVRGKVQPYLLTSITFVLLLMFPFLLPNFFNGMETAIFTVVLYYMYRTAIFKDFIKPTLFTVLLALAISLRLDSLICLLPLIALLVYWIIKKETNIRPINVLSGLTIGVAMQVLALALSEFSVPLSFQHKFNRTFNMGTFQEYLLLFSLVNIPAFVVYMFQKNGKLRKTKIFEVTTMSLYFICISLFYSFFSSWMFYRYGFPFIFVTFSLVMFNIMNSEKLPVALVSALLIYYLLLFIKLMPVSYQYVSGYRVLGMPAVRDMTLAMKQSNLPPEFRTVASYDAGYIPYNSEWRFTDLQGLVTPEVKGERVGNIIKKLNPTILIVSSFFGIYSEGKFSSQYQNGEDEIPSNYTKVSELSLTNEYLLRQNDYVYHIYLNENANAELVSKFRALTVNTEDEIGIQKYVFNFFKNLSGLK